MTSFAQKKKFRKMDKSEIQKRKAEGRTVKGNVSFKNEGLAGASIYLKGTQMGDNTNYKNIIVSAVIGKDFLDLVISDLIQKSNLVIEKDIRHSSHIIPSSEDVSYNNKSGDFWEIYSVDIRNLMTKKIADINGK